MACMAAAAQPQPRPAFGGLRLDDGLARPAAAAALTEAPGAGQGPGPGTRLGAPHRLGGDCGLDARVHPVDLQDTLSLALCNAPATRESWARMQAASAQWQAERLQGRPTAALTLGLGRQGSRVADAGEPAQTTRGAVHGAALEVSWLLHDFGQRDAVVQTAAHLLHAAGAAHDQVVQDTVLAAGRAYFNLVEAKAVQALLLQSEQATQRLLQQATRPQRSGEALDPLGVLQARTAIEKLRLERAQAAGVYQQARGALASALGLPPHTPVDVLADPALQPQPGLADDAAALVARALQDNPALRAARARSAAAQAELDGARRAGRPTLSAVHAARRDRDVFGSRGASWAVGLELSVPLLDQGLRKQRIAQARHEAEAARAGVQELGRSTALDLWGALVELSAQLAAHEQAGRLLAQAQELLAAETSAFHKGDSDMFDVLDAQASVDEATRERLGAALASGLARLRLAAAMGQLGAPR
jgi:outer membrane protein